MADVSDWIARTEIEAAIIASLFDAFGFCPVRLEIGKRPPDCPHAACPRKTMALETDRV